MTVIEQKASRQGLLRIGLGFGFVLLCMAIMLYRMLWFYRQGGDSYQQGDWLVNFAGGPVRRGFSGEFALSLSRLFDVDVLLVVVVLQGTVICGIILASGLVAWRHRFHDRAMLLLLAPGYISYFVYMTPGALRKEILGYFAFLPLLISPKNDGWALAWLALCSVLYTMALSFHEVNAFLLPFLGAAFILRLRHMQAYRGAGLAILASMGAVAVAGTLFAQEYTNITDLEAVCAVLVDRGISSELCYSGILQFLASADSGNTLRGLNIWEVTEPALFFSALSICLLPLVVLFQSAPHRGRDLAVVLGSGVLLLPLFVLGTDWGRWIVMYTFSVTLALWVYMDAECPDWFATPLPRIFGPLLLLLCMCVGIRYIPAHLVSGVLPEFWGVFSDKVLGL